MRYIILMAIAVVTLAMALWLSLIGPARADVPNSFGYSVVVPDK